MRIAELYDQFTRERKHLHNVSPNTLDWYKYSFRAFAPHLSDVNINHPTLRGVLKLAVIALSESGLQPSSLNDYVRAINAFLRWGKEEGYLAFPAFASCTVPGVRRDRLGEILLVEVSSTGLARFHVQEQVFQSQPPARLLYPILWPTLLTQSEM